MYVNGEEAIEDDWESVFNNITKDLRVINKRIKGPTKLSATTKIQTPKIEKSRSSARDIRMTKSQPFSPPQITTPRTISRRYVNDPNPNEAISNYKVWPCRESAAERIYKPQRPTNYEEQPAPKVIPVVIGKKLSLRAKKRKFKFIMPHNSLDNNPELDIPPNDSCADNGA